MSQTQPTPEQGDSTESERLRQLIMGLLNRHRFLHQYRLQKLVYLAELLYTERTNGDRLTDARYKPYRFGAYSEDVDDMLQEVSKSNPSISRRHKRKYGNDTYTYKANGMDVDIDEDIEDLINVVVNLTRRKSSDELAKWSKSTYLFNETDYDDEMSFDKYYSEYLDTGNTPDWKPLT